MALVGAAAGLLGGLLGIGGGLILIPALVFILGEDHFGQGSLHLYKLISLITAIVLSFPAALRHVRVRAVVPRMVFRMAPLGALGVLVGVLAAGLFAAEHTHVLRRIFGGFMIVCVLADLALANRNPADAAGATCPAPTRWGAVGALVGLPAGLIAGLLGIGGGVWAVPVQHLVLRVRVHNAIANSTCLIVALCAVAAIAQGLAVQAMGGLRLVDGLALCLWIAPGAVLGGWAGAALSQRLHVVWLRRAFDVVLAISGLRLLS